MLKEKFNSNYRCLYLIIKSIVPLQNIEIFLIRKNYKYNFIEQLTYFLIL